MYQVPRQITAHQKVLSLACIIAKIIVIWLYFGAYTLGQSVRARCGRRGATWIMCEAKIRILVSQWKQRQHASAAPFTPKTATVCVPKQRPTRPKLHTWHRADCLQHFLNTLIITKETDKTGISQKATQSHRNVSCKYNKTVDERRCGMTDTWFVGQKWCTVICSKIVQLSTAKSTVECKEQHAATRPVHTTKEQHAATRPVHTTKTNKFYSSRQIVTHQAIQSLGSNSRTV
jgi:hypothetical protein